MFLILSFASLYYAPGFAYKDDRVSVQKSGTDSAVVADPLKIVVYYFHGTHRCSTCLRMEEYSREAIGIYFSEELKEGKLEFKLVNIDEPENRHFIKDFQLYTRSLVLALYNGNALQKYKNLSDIWSYSNERLKFYLYVKNETEQFLKESQ